MTAAAPGTILYNILGHPYRVISGGPWLYRVQPLQPDGRDVTYSGPVLLGFSDIDKTRLAPECRS